MKLFFLIFLTSLAAWSEEKADIEEQQKKCEDSLDKAKDDVRDYQRSIQYNTIPSAHAVDPASGQPISTGNPITDMFSQMNQLNQQMAQIKQQESQAMAQAEDDCFSKFEKNEDEREQNRRKGYEGLEQIALAENEKQKQINQIHGTCLSKSMEMATADRQRLAGNYNQRLVSTVGGATQSKKQLANLPAQYNQQCLKAAKYALETADQDLATKMRIYNIRTEEIISADAYLDIKKAKLSDYCEKRYDRIASQAADQKNSIAQSQMLTQIGALMALRTANASGEEQQRVDAVHTSLQALLEPTYWNNLKITCANQFQETKGGTTRVPADVYSSFSDVNKYCRPPNAPDSQSCISTTGRESVEKQKQRSGATGTNL